MSIESYQSKRRALMDKYGWLIQSVGSDVQLSIPSFSYTIGLVSMGMNDLIIVGTPPETGDAVVRLIVEKMMAKKILGQDNEVVTEAANFPVHLKSTTSHAIEYFALGAGSHARSQGLEPKVLQVVFPDRDGLFPWQEGCAPDIRRMQDIPGLAAIQARAEESDRPAAQANTHH